VLIARGHKRIGLGELRWALTFAPRFWSVVVERTGLVLDTRFIPAAVAPARPRSCLYLLLQGSWTLYGAEETRIEAPCVFIATEEQLEGAGGSRPYTFSARGDPFRAIELHVADADLSVAPLPTPVRLTIDEGTLAAAFEVGSLADQDDATLERGFRGLLEHLARQGLLRRELLARALRPSSKAFALLWAALRPMIERLYLNPTLQEVGEASGLSTRQLDRYVQRFVTSFGLVGERWRSSTLHIRLKLAIILLSADEASIADVAAAVGYGSSDAMARMFRDAGLPPPATLQQQLRAARGQGTDSPLV
jgi:AraC-like DNA-binding protein